jgi:two-component sensor histidine kinase
MVRNALVRFRVSSGKVLTMLWSAEVIDLEGQTCIICVPRDITERIEAEERIKTSLKEKELLLREVHHRVKNNLQIILSLMNLQARYLKDGESFRMFMETQNRISSMAAIHESLYRSGTVAMIDFTGYVRDIAAGLFRSYSVTPANVKMKIDASDVHMDADMAIPCGLIINEMVSNSMKFAFPGERKGEIYISFRQEGDDCTMVVGDDGVGFPTELDFRSKDTLGLRLVNILLEQLDGDMSLDRDGGTRFTVSFKKRGDV